MPFTADQEQELPHIISLPRFGTYIAATQNNKQKALQLYQWNLEISAALIVPLQVCEVATRNGVVLALEQTYGSNWHLSSGFLQSLPRSRSGYCPAQDFESTANKLRRRKALSAGKLVADLKFAFWENMLTKRHDKRLWEKHFFSAFPHANNQLPYFQVRGTANQSLEQIRRLRNRIAHHEPIFKRNIEKEYKRITDIIAWRSPASKEWVDSIQHVLELNNSKPIP